MPCLQQDNQLLAGCVGDEVEARQLEVLGSVRGDPGLIDAVGRNAGVWVAVRVGGASCGIDESIGLSEERCRAGGGRDGEDAATGERGCIHDGSMVRLFVEHDVGNKEALLPRDGSLVLTRSVPKSDVRYLRVFSGLERS